MTAYKNIAKEITAESFKLATMEKARRSLLHFTTYTKPDYQVNWHHAEIARTLQAFADGEIKNLIISLPPQHGKSEMATRRLASFLLGKDPSNRIAIGAYNATLAMKFNREIQRIITSNEYCELFPGTRLNEKNVATDAKGSFLRNSTEFEIVGTGGYLIAQGVGGALTSYTVDIALIDDPYKGPTEAYSTTFRNRVKEWWDDVLLTRLHNDSQICLTMTRWHHDDIAGRLLKEQPGEWVELKLKAIKAGPDLDYLGNEIFEREEGEALWPEKHSLKKLLKRKAISPTTFESLYQQEPTAASGNLLKRHHFGRFLLHDLPPTFRVKWVMDSAYTSKEENDPSEIWIYTFYNGNWYVLDVATFRKGWNDAVRLVPDIIRRWDRSLRASGRIEPKANGLSLIQKLRVPEYETNSRNVLRPALNVIAAKAPTVDKVARTNINLPEIESGKIYFLEGAEWVERVILQLIQFPKAKHDESVDCMNMMISAEISGGFTVTGNK